MKKKYLLFVLILAVFEVVAQTRYAVFVNTGYSFSNSLQLNNEEVENSRGYVISFGGKVKVFSIKKNYVETGLAGKTIFATGSVNGEHFTSTTLRLVFPLKMIFSLTEKWAVSTGFNFQNNLDFTNSDFRPGYKYLWRVDYSAGMKYLLANQWFLTTNIDFNLGKIPDVFFINDPKFAVLIGIEKQFYKKRKTK